MSEEAILMDSVCEFHLLDIERPKKTASQKDLRSIKSNLTIEISGCNTCLVVIAINKNKELNNLLKVRCEGTSVGGYVYNVIEDCYHVRCAGCLDLGSVPIAFSLRTIDNRFWMANIPLPEFLIKKYLNEFQETQLNIFKNNFSVDDNIFEYLQCIE
jgi:hypothetical protein